LKRFKNRKTKKGKEKSQKKEFFACPFLFEKRKREKEKKRKTTKKPPKVEKNRKNKRTENSRWAVARFLVARFLLHVCGRLSAPLLGGEYVFLSKKKAGNMFWLISC
jgi:uncharacterized MAPEG superfamily protein